MHSWFFFLKVLLTSWLKSFPFTTWSWSGVGAWKEGAQQVTCGPLSFWLTTPVLCGMWWTWMHASTYQHIILQHNEILLFFSCKTKNRKHCIVVFVLTVLLFAFCHHQWSCRAACLTEAGLAAYGGLSGPGLLWTLWNQKVDQPHSHRSAGDIVRDFPKKW